jgi:acetylornithine/succinyldiaminopimelate/putrescine aminotransferase
MNDIRGHDTPLAFDALVGDRSGSLSRALSAGKKFLAETPTSSLLTAVGRTIEAVPASAFPDRRWFQKSFGRVVTDRPDDLLVGHGLFYLTEQRRLFLDCTAGHYQMTWGYDPPELHALLLDGIERGIVWDNHSNIPPAPVKSLSARLAALANPDVDVQALRADGSRLNTVLLGVVTGSVACGAAMKIMLMRHAQVKRDKGAPVFVTLQGNYHGTDVFAQRLRGMWVEYFCNVEVAQVPPNDGEELAQVFRRYGERVAGFWAEPIMMNCEALTLDPSYLQLARALCDQAGALMALDEIQTGFWFPEVFYTNRLSVEPDFIVLGKGMTAGFHPLSALVYRGDLDCLAQYDAISTNGNAALAAYLGLGCIALIEHEAGRIAEVGAHLHSRMSELCCEFPDLLQEVRGEGHMTGLKFRRVEDALGFHRCAFERGLWVRVHAYHAGHSTILTKFALLLDEEVADFAANTMRTLLAERPWK